MDALKLVSVSFHCAGKIFDFDAGDLELGPGDKVIVETERGRALGTIVSGPRPTAAEEAPPKLKTVLRIATPADHDMAQKNAEREKEAITFCRERIRQRGLDMKLVRAEYLFDGSKVLFYFTADGRIDFRDLVRDLAQHLRTRIEMRQIGVRDEAKLVGGLGVCGRELCCSSYLREFAPVSVKMAKAQGLALNPSKISGQCGRLLCCLAYEYENYNEMRKTLPKIGKKLTLPGGTAEVISLDILKQSVTLSCPGGERCRMEIAALQKEIAAAQQAGDAPPPAEAPQPRKKSAASAPSAPTKGAPAPGKKPAQRRSKPPAATSGATRSAPPQAEEQKPATEDKTPRRRRRPRRRSNKPKDPGPEST
ncbi:MAG: regulatory iron-sulfur-containing complex subunit RicT [Pelovirga sp.]